MNIVNSFAEQWWPYVYHAMWQASLVAAIALALVTVFRRLPSPWRYALLLIALVKFSIPPVLTTSFGVFHWTGPVVRVQYSGVKSQEFDTAVPAAMRPVPAQAIAPTIGNPQSPIGNLTSQISNLSWQSWLMLLHAAGTLLVLLWIARGFYHLVRLTRRADLVRPGSLSEPHASSGAPATSAAADLKSQASLHARFTSLAKRLDLKDDIDLLITDAPIPPVAFGLLRPKVMLPRPLLDQLTPQQLDTILAHELVHHRRNDPAANFFQLLLLAGWWFNPLLWLLHRALAGTREECCDDALLGSNLATADGYAQTLLHTARQLTTRPPLGATLGFAERLHPMGNRLKRILDPALKRVPKLSPEGLVVAGVLAIAVLPGLRSGWAQPAAPAPVADIVRGPIDPYVPGHERVKFVASARVDSEMDEKEFIASQKPNGFARSFDHWKNLLLFDKDGNGRIDWFEADGYRQSLRLAVLARYDQNQTGYLEAPERLAANRDLASGRVPQVGTEPITIHASAASQKGPLGNLFNFGAKVSSSVERYDGDGDGKLDELESAVVPGEALAAIRLVGLIGTQFDDNGDGRDDPAERERFDEFFQELSKIVGSGLDDSLRGPDGKYVNARDLSGAAQFQLAYTSVWLLARVIAFADRDGDGIVSDSEGQAFRTGVVVAVEEHTKRWIERFDADGNARLSPDERPALLDWLREGAASIKAKHDSDSDGRLSPAEAGQVGMAYMELLFHTFPANPN